MRTVLLIASSIVLTDQVSKAYIISDFLQYQYITVIPGIFDIRYIRNTGAAYGMFSDSGHMLVILSFVMLILLAIFRKKIFTTSLMNIVSFGLIAGGIIGNLIDRLKYGYVVDFLDFHWGTHSFPAFNIADSAICIGVGLYILHQYLIGRKEQVPVPDKQAKG